MNNTEFLKKYFNDLNNLLKTGSEDINKLVTVSEILKKTSAAGK